MYFIQSLILLAGTIFAWFTVCSDFSRFYNLYGNITKISGCVIPNPVTTPCFYGAFAFLGAFIWSLYVQRMAKGKRITHQKKLSIFLIASTIFAWSNLALEIYHFYLQKTGSRVSCSGIATDNIFTTACFIGSMIFLTSLIISLIINNENKTPVKNN
jgi:hypothetical protein